MPLLYLESPSNGSLRHPPCRRLLLPEHVRLDSLMCCCPGQPVFFGLSRALSVCRSIHVCGATVHMLLSVRSVS